MPPAASLFDLDFDPDWGYERRPFLDAEHRYSKMHRLLREHYGDLAGTRILDLGCCRGQLLARFDGYRDVELVGLEIDPEEIELARARGLSPVRHHINVFDGDRMTARLPFPDEGTDVVLAGEIIEHIVDTEGFLREIGRVLSPGGAVVLTTPNILWWKHRLELLAGRYPAALDHRLRYGDDFGHVRAFTPAILRGLLEETGYVDVVLAGRRLGPIASLTSSPQLVARALDRLADRLPSLSDTIVALARTQEAGASSR